MSDTASAVAAPVSARTSLDATTLCVPVGHYRLRLIAEEPLQLPPYAGSAWRGLLGHRLRAAACVTGLRKCTGCLLRTSCVYAYVFETPPPPDTTRMRRYPAAPHPFVLAPRPQRARRTPRRPRWPRTARRARRPPRREPRSQGARCRGSRGSRQVRPIARMDSTSFRFCGARRPGRFARRLGRRVHQYHEIRLLYTRFSWYKKSDDPTRRHSQ
jgi:hypothetical protein